MKQSAKEVLEIVETGHYPFEDRQLDIKAQCRSAIENSRLYRPEDLENLRQHKPDGPAPVVEVVDGYTQSHAQHLSQDGRFALLNFASARNPGGGFLNGAKAQEEDLCRCSALYSTLLPHTSYYAINRKKRSLLYTDHLIFSPGVPFFRIKGDGAFLEQPFLASVITAPAPNSGPYLRRSGDPDQLEECFERRWSNVLVAATDQGITTLLLGAWGCGAFGGEAELASTTAKRAIEIYGSGFTRIVFAIPGQGKRSWHNLETFKTTFEG